MTQHFRRIIFLLLALLVLTGCAGGSAAPAASPPPAAPAETLRLITEPSEAPPERAKPAPTASAAPAATPAATPEAAEDAAAEIDEDGSYTSPEDVAAYLHRFGHLPDNFITKKEAKALGWPGGDLWKYAPGKSIGGDRFGNYEGLLPDDSYRECDVNYAGGKRGAERLIFGTDGSVYYTGDHYETFTQLY